LFRYFLEFLQCLRPSFGKNDLFRERFAAIINLSPSAGVIVGVNGDLGFGDHTPRTRD
jgi:hypothetical protein